MGSYRWDYRVLLDIMGLWGPTYRIIGFYGGIMGF